MDRLFKTSSVLTTLMNAVCRYILHPNISLKIYISYGGAMGGQVI